MLMITRTQSRVELDNGDRRLVAFDAADVIQAMLSIERAPCGAVCHVLALTFAGVEPPLRLEGSVAELRELHDVVAEIMHDLAPDGSVH